MGFAVSTTPLEANTGYITSKAFSYAVFSLWFDRVKLDFANEDNFSELKSDRMEAIFNSGSYFAIISFSDKGFGNGHKPAIKIKTDNGVSTYNQIFEVVDAEEDESLEDLTMRWVESVHNQIGTILTNNKIRARWFSFSFEVADVASEPPKLFPPTT